MRPYSAFVGFVGVALLSGQDLQSLRDMTLEDLMNVKVVSASRRTQRVIDSVRSVSVLTRQELLLRNYRTVPEALMELAGVMVQETNYGGGAPIIRGMVGNRILLLVDGVRMNNSIYRLGPNQYLNTIDIHQVERIEVIRGPSSILYGSDALGGLINIVTVSPPKDRSRPQVRAAGRFATADRGVSTRLEASGRSGNIGYYGGASGRHFGDLRAGRRTGLQPFTGYDEYDGDLKLDVTLPRASSLQVAMAHVNQRDVPRTDALTAGTELEYNWDPQQRNLVHGLFQIERPMRSLDSLQIGFSYQHHLERLNRIAAARPTSRMRSRDSVGSTGLTAQAASVWGERHLFTYGGEFYGDRVGSTARLEDLRTGVSAPAKPTFADGARFRTLAAYLQDDIQVTRRLTLIPGVRFSFFDMDARVQDPAAGSREIDSRPHAFTGKLYAGFELRPKLSLFAGVSQGFRAPNTDDLTIFGPISNGFEVPGENLQPEFSANGEVGIKTQRKHFSGSVSAYASRYRDLIERRPATLDGLDFLDVNGNGLRDRGEVSLFARQNIGKARVRGVTAEGQWRFDARWAIFGNVDWTHGKDLLSGQPLTRIPPLKGLAGTRWNLTRHLWFETYLLAAGRQSRLSASDRTDRRIRPGGTPGFALLNLRGGVDVPGLGTLSVGLENVTDKTYRWHGSGLDGPGRNLVFGLARSF